MDKEDIQLDDWQRILIGNNSWEFMLEVFGRSLIIYFCLVVVMRLLGKRMNAQLTITEFAVMLSLGAIVSVPMQAPSRGILPGVILLVGILLLHQGYTLLSYKRRKVEVVTQGIITLVAKNGVVDPEQLRRMRMSKDQIFSILRAKGIRHLGQVKRLYSEADGHFSLYKLKEARPGLSVFPRSANVLPPDTEEVHDKQACCYCGNLVERTDEPPGRCSNCGHQEWIPAVH